MKIDIVSVFPEYFDVMGLSLMGKAQEKGLLSITAHNLRDWTHDVHHSVDDTPVGGGAGLVMKPAVWAECLDELLGFTADDGAVAPANDGAATPADNESPTPVLIFPNPSAPLFTQQDATELSHADHLLFGCGRYEGYDARIPEYYRSHGVDVREYSIGDYVLNGGEVATSVMLEAITRLIPGFMGNADSIVEESYTGANALLEHRQYTRGRRPRSSLPPPGFVDSSSSNYGRASRAFHRLTTARTTPTNNPPGCLLNSIVPQRGHASRVGRSLCWFDVEDGGFAVVAVVGNLPTSRRGGSVRAGRTFQHNHRAISSEAVRGQIGEQPITRLGFERIRRIDENHVERTGRTRTGSHVCLGLAHEHAHREIRRPRPVALQLRNRLHDQCSRRLRRLHGHQLTPATRERLDAERTRTGEQVEHACPVEHAPRVEAREHRLLGAVGGGSGAGFRRGQRHTLESS